MMIAFALLLPSIALLDNAESFIGGLPLGCRGHNDDATVISRSAPLRMGLSGAESKTNRGFRLLELAGGLVPQSGLVKAARFAWKTIWLQMMRELAPQSSDGGYVRPTYGFRGTIGSPEFPADSGRYHVYLGNACPWCHRVALALVLLGIGGSVSSSRMLDDPERASRGGWAFGPGGFEDPVFGCSDLRAVYDLCQPGYQGRCTAPLLVDRKTRRIVNNESSDIIRHLNAAVVALLSGSGSGSEGTLGGVVELRPVALAEEIDRINEMTYTKLNNAVYRCGFATSQKAYEAALADVVEGLERCDELLSKRRFLAGDVFTEADLRLFPTIIRFDVVYATLFKCQRRRVVDSPNVSAWMRDVYQLPGVAATIDVGDAIRSYYTNLFPLNPGGIVPLGPDAEDLELEREANRGSRDHEAVFVSRAFPVQSNGHLIL